MSRSLIKGAIAAIAVTAALVAPSVASATQTTYTYQVPIKVAGYEVKTTVVPAPSPPVDGLITHMDTDVVDADGTPIPIDRLMLHHIVYMNPSKTDATCGGADRFYAAGEERAQMTLPPGYGYPLQASDHWHMLYMVMNHRQTVDEGFIQYTVTVDDDPSVQKVIPYWFDEHNCSADPIYNVPGNGGKKSRQDQTADFTLHESGRLVAAGGHVHGGAYRLTLNEPNCGDRALVNSKPTWGTASNPFYNVKPVLHEPGPISMSSTSSVTGIPVNKGEALRLNSVYDNSRPHVRVMGIMVAYFAPDPTITTDCGPIPDDVEVHVTDRPGRHQPVKYRIPIYNLDDSGEAVRVKAPPGDLETVPSGTMIDVANRTFDQPNIEILAGQTLNWQFDGGEPHNVTLANGPVGIGSPNLNGGSTFSKVLQKPGTYRLFCSLHPVQMTQRVVVLPAGRKKQG
jgi:plastocyanin